MNARQPGWRASISLLRFVIPLAALLVTAGCESDSPKFPESGDTAAPAPASAPAFETNAVATPAPAPSSAPAANVATTPAPAGNAPSLFSPIGGTNSPAAVDTNTTAALDDKRVLSVGDRLSFRILEDNDDPKQLVVTDSGDLEVPLLGRRSVSGLTCEQLAAQLKKDFEAKYYYHATVVISLDSMSRSLGRVYASGALRAPGPLEIPGDEVFTLSKAVLRAGGFTDFADTHNVKVTRKSLTGGANQTFTVDVGQILEKGRTELDLTLEPGDMVYVAERVIRF